MKNIFLLITFLNIFVIHIYAVGVPAKSEEVNVLNNKLHPEDIELKEIYEILKKHPEVNFYYHKETVIKEQQQDEYVEHLVAELKRALKKGKKQGVLRRVEGNLAEINKGSIHKVRERDVYKVYDSSGIYKGKLEIAAIADAVSIGENYGVKHKFEQEDNIKLLGQRKLFKYGLEVNVNKKFEAYVEDMKSIGLIFEYTVRGGWGFELLLMSNFERFEHRVDNEVYGKLSDINIPVGINKYFNSPGSISPHIGIGGAINNIKRYYYIAEGYEQINGVAKTTRGIIPAFKAGVQVTPFSLLADIGVRYFYEPDVKINGYLFKQKPVMFYFSIMMGW